VLAAAKLATDDLAPQNLIFRAGGKRRVRSVVVSSPKYNLMSFPCGEENHLLGIVTADDSWSK